MTTLEVLDRGQRSLRELTEQTVAAHDDVLRAGVDMIAAAVRAGHALREIKSRYQSVEVGGWRAWVDAHLPFSYGTANLYMRCADNEGLIREQGWDRLHQVKRGLGELVAPDHSAKGATGKGKPEWMKVAAREMYADGVLVAHIARDLGVTPESIKCWVDPEYEKQRRVRIAAINKRRIQAERVLREAEREQRIGRALKAAGGALAEAYASAERMQDVLGRAHSEATDREAREALARAGESYRRMRDEIVRALGVS